MAAPIAEYAGDARDFALADAVAAGKPLVVRGLCRDWPLVGAARRGFGEFAQAIAALDNGTPVDVLRMPPEAGGVVGYNADLDGFNYQHFKVTATEAITHRGSRRTVADSATPATIATMTAIERAITRSTTGANTAASGAMSLGK